MKNLQNAVNNAKNLDELVDALNELDAAIKEANESEENQCDYDSLDRYVDICDLQNFGKEPEDTMEIFSWDDERVMIQNTCIDEDGAFILQERSEEFGK